MLTDVTSVRVGTMGSAAEQAYAGHRDDPSFTQSLHDLRVELRGVADDGNAPRNAAFARGILGVWTVPQMVESLAVLHEADPDRTGPERFRMVRTAAATLLLRRPGFVYPDDYPEDSAVVDGLRWIFDDPALTEEFNNSLAAGKLHTSVPQRYVSDLIAAMASGHAISDPRPVRLDIGCSLNYGNMQVLSRDINPFRDVQVLVEPAGGGKPAVDPDKTELLNRSLRDPRLVVADTVVGIDEVDVVNSVSPEWMQMLLTPDEILLGGMAKLYNELRNANISPERLSFILADIARKTDVDRLLEVMGGRKFSVASDVAALYQVSSARLKRSRDNIRRLLAKDGYAYFCDFLTLADGEGGTYLAPLRKWDRMNLILYRRRERKLHLIASFTSGRARAVRFYPIFGELARGGPFEDVAVELSS